MVHSGGFYLVEKQKVPRLMPSKLHWFRWEAATTWLSGFVLLVVVYYAGGAVLVDDTISHVTIPQAVALGVGLLAVAWFVYDWIWRSPLARNEVACGTVCYFLLVGATWALTRVYSGRAAYIHVGAVMGTLMTANVWLRIAPAYRRIVSDVRAGAQPDEALLARVQTRSKHNAFLAMPAVFTMISNHYPLSTYGSEHAWVVLSILILVGWAAAKIIRDH
jgi:uncharacterized membrane protein